MRLWILTDRLALHDLPKALFKECYGMGELVLAAHRIPEIPARCKTQGQTRRYEGIQDYIIEQWRWEL